MTPLEHVAGHLTLVVALTAGGHAMTHCARDLALIRALGAATSSWAAASCTRAAVVRATRAGLLAECELAARIDHTGLRILCRHGIIHPEATARSEDKRTIVYHLMIDVAGVEVEDRLRVDPQAGES